MPLTMPFCFDDLTPLARAAVPAHSTRFAPERVLWEDTLPGGAHWSGVLRRGTTLRFTDLTGSANVAALMFNQEHLGERYNMPDTLKAQHTARLTQGHVCFSDMGRVLCSVAHDSCGWHDTVCGVLTAAGLRAQYGEQRYQEHRNEMFRNGQDGLLIELAKWGLDHRDLHANLNLFSKVSADEAGGLQFDRAHRAAGQTVDLRFEMNVLLVLSTAPHPLDPATQYAPGAVQLTAWRSGTAGADDPCRLHCAENGRGFINTERSFL
jgi:urea carboxylase-associated protein 2